jgi:hypothetical protein
MRRTQLERRSVTGWPTAREDREAAGGRADGEAAEDLDEALRIQRIEARNSFASSITTV